MYGFEHAASAILSTHYHSGIQNQMMSCLSGIDIACLDAIGKMLSLPVVKLLGGPARDRLPIYASGGSSPKSGERLPRTTRNVCASAESKRAKIKIGAGPQCDRERVSIARKVLGDDMGIVGDANGNYTYDKALESKRRIADYGIEWYEEPLPPLISTDMPPCALVRRSRSRRTVLACRGVLHAIPGFSATDENRAVTLAFWQSGMTASSRKPSNGLNEK